MQLICRYLAASTWPDRGGAPVPPGVKVEKSTKEELMDLRATWQVSLSLSLSLIVKGLFLYTFGVFFSFGVPQ